MASLPNLLIQEPAERLIPVSPARTDLGRSDESGRKLTATAAFSQDARLNVRAALLMDANNMLRQERSRQPRFPGDFSDVRSATANVLFNAT